MKFRSRNENPPTHGTYIIRDNVVGKGLFYFDADSKVWYWSAGSDHQLGINHDFEWLDESAEDEKDKEIEKLKYDKAELLKEFADITDRLEIANPEDIAGTDQILVAVLEDLRAIPEIYKNAVTEKGGH